MELKNEVWPLDEALLRILPEEGSKLGFHNLGKTVANLREELNAALPDDSPEEAFLTPEQISSRLRSAKVNGLATDVPGGKGGTRLWQRTAKGKRYIEENA